MITQKKLKEYFTYDKESGDFYYKARQREDCVNYPVYCLFKKMAGNRVVGAKRDKDIRIDGKFYKRGVLAVLYCHGVITNVRFKDGNKKNARYNNLIFEVKRINIYADTKRQKWVMTVNDVVKKEGELWDILNYRKRMNA